jgi:hypothetical protein
MATTQIRGLTQINNDVIKIDGSVPMAAALKLGTGTPATPTTTNFLQCVTDPSNPQDGATKHYVDGQIASSSTPTSSATARVLSNAQIIQSGVPGNVDGIANLTAGQVICCNGQTAPAQNGLFVIASGAWTRAPSMANWSQVPGLIVSIQEGTTYHDTLWLSVADASAGPIGTGSITFTEIPGPQDIIPGKGLTRTGQTLDVTCPDNTLALAVGSVKVNIGVLPLKSDFVNRETPGGLVNGSNTLFTLAFAPVLNGPGGTSGETIYLNGLLQEPGSGNDYTISGQNITFLTAPLTNDRIRANYVKGAAIAGP